MSAWLLSPEVLSVDHTGLPWDKDNIVLGDDRKVTAQSSKWWWGSILGNQPDLPGHSPRQPAIAVTLALLGGGLEQT